MIFVVALLVLAASSYEVEARKPVICYYTNWSQYRPGTGKFIPSNIDVSLCDDLIYAFAFLSESRPCTLTPIEWNDDGSNGLYEQFTSLKMLKPGLRTLLAVGGWTMGTTSMTLMLSTQETRAEFVSSSIEYLRSRNFDGLDLDFEYPGSRGSPPEDKQRFASLVQELKAAYDEEGRQTGQTPLMVTAALGAPKSVIDNGYQVEQICQDLDYISLMSYDFEGAWNPYTGHNAPLKVRSDQVGNDVYLNVEWVVNYLVEQGCPKDKLIIGIPTYGRAFSLIDPSQTGFKAPTGGAAPAGPFTREAGFYGYYEICSSQGFTRVFDSESKVAYQYSDSVWIGFDDRETVRKKAQWINQEGYMGAMIWSLDLDDFTGSFCSEGSYPLLTEINLALNGDVPTEPPFTGSSTTATTNTVTTTTTTQPPGEEICKDDPNGNVAHPDDCTKFYMCSSGVPNLNQCTGNTYFNPITAGCDWWENLSDDRQAQCEGTEPETTTTTNTTTPAPQSTTATTPTTKTTTTTSGPVTTTTTAPPADTCEGLDSGYVAYPGDCTKFYQCVNGQGTENMCAPGTFFCPSMGICNWWDALTDERKEECSD